MDVWRCGPPPADGQRQRYPTRFWYYFKRAYPDIAAAIANEPGAPRVLHMFSGSMDWGDTTDIRPETGAKVVAPFDSLPRSMRGYDWVIADPPYTTGFANEWRVQPKDVPKPKHVLRAALRAVKPGGYVGILHVITIPAYKALKAERVGMHFLPCGPNNHVRCFQVYRRQE